MSLRYLQIFECFFRAVASSGLYGCKSKKTWHTAKVQAPFLSIAKNEGKTLLSYPRLL